MPEQDRICPHCGKDQSVTPEKGGAGIVSSVLAASSGLPPGDDPSDPFAAARDKNDFTAAGLGPHATDEGAARRRRKAIGVVALIAGVLLLGMAYDRYAKQRAATPPPPTLAQEAPTTATRPATATGPVVRAPAAAAAPSAASGTTPVAPPAMTPPATSPDAPATADNLASPCNEALAAMSLCARP